MWYIILMMMYRKYKGEYICIIHMKCWKSTPIGTGIFIFEVPM